MECPTKSSGSVRPEQGPAIPRITLAGSLALLAGLGLVACMADPATAVARPGSDSAARQSFQTLFPSVRAQRGCTQEDAPATEIIFFAQQTAAGEPAAPYVRIEISGSSRERIGPATFRLMPLRRSSGERGRIVRAELVQKPGSSTWLQGTIAIRSDDPGTAIAGRVDLVSPKGGAWSRSFSAPYVPRQAICG